MSPLPRLVLPATPLHITQRGVDRCPTFLCDEDFAFYRWALREAAVDAGCAVHAYAFMTNHVHLLLTPVEACGPSRMMQSLGRRYVRYFNDRYARTGTLWEGRYRSAVVTDVKYLFDCSRYIELNPVEAGLVSDPVEYEWSSHRCNARGDEDPGVTARAEYLALGENRREQCRVYSSLFAEKLSSGVAASIGAALRGRPKLNPTGYRQAVEHMYDRSGNTVRSNGALVTAD